MISTSSPTTPQDPPLTKSVPSRHTDTDSCLTLESETSTIAPQNAPIRMRRIGSLTEEIEQIKDEESRRLTELAYLS